MNCSDFKHSLFAWSEKDFTAFSAEEFDTHSQECDACFHLQEEFIKTIGIIELDKQTEPISFAETRLLQRLENYTEARKSRFSALPQLALRPVYVGLGVAAAILLGVVMGFEESSLRMINKENKIDIESVRVELNMPDIMGDNVTQF